MLPEGWESTTLGEIMDFRNGLNFSQSDSKNLIKVVGVSDFSLGNVLSRTDSLKETYVDQFKDDDLLQENDFLFVRSNGNKSLIGRCLYFPHIPEPISFSGFTIRGRLKNPLISATYIFQIVAGEYFRKYINLSGSGTNISNLSQEILSNTPLILPPLPEQKKIAAILSTWDRAIDGAEKLLANSQQQKKALMQQLLTGKKRLPGFTGEWETKYLGDIADIQTGSSNRQDSLTNGEYTFFDRSEDIRTSNRYLFDCEAVIVPGEGQDFVPKYFVGKFDLHQRTYAISCFQACDGKFIFYTVGYHRSHFLSQAVGSTVKSLRLPMFQKMPLKLPPLSEQRAIAAVLTTADEEITAIESDLLRLRQEKKALMQQLLTGKRRVRV
ncbi:restriction endonuclease subunit S, partial [Acetobacter cerevisiae]